MTLEEFREKVTADRGMMEEFMKASEEGTLADFAGKHGCTATDEEIRRAFISMRRGALSDDDLEAVSGGAFDFGKWLSDLFKGLFGGGDSDDDDTSGSVVSGVTGGVSKANKVVGGGTVKVNNPVPENTIVSKGKVSTLGNAPMTSIVKKM